MKKQEEEFDWTNKRKIPKLDSGAGERISKSDESTRSVPKQPTDSIDLHFDKLFNPAQQVQFSAGEKLNKQLNALDSFIKQSLRNRLVRITAIHGQGQGKLREEILNKFSKHPHVQSMEDAPFSRYGMQAALYIFIQEKRKK